MSGIDRLEARLPLAGDIPIDTQPPTVSITSNNPVMRLGAPATLTFTLSEDATGFDASDLGVTPGLGTLSNFSGSGRTYTATLTPSTAFNDQRSVQVWVEAGRLTDLAGNVNAKQTATFTINNIPVDTTPPTVTITSSAAALKPGASTTVLFKLSEPSTNFTLSDIAVTPNMGTITAFSQLTGSAFADGLTYRATFTAAQNVTGISTAVISVAQGAFTDAAGNGNVAGSLSLTIDAVPPTLAITTSTQSLRVGQTATITFTMSEDVVGFTASSIVFVNGTLSNFRGSGRSYTATFTPRANFTGLGTASVAAGAFTDTVGNANLAATLQISITT